MECIHCKGRMKRGTAPFSLDRNGYHVSWDAVPARVCTQCGEPFFEAREVGLDPERPTTPNGRGISSSKD